MKLQMTWMLVLASGLAAGTPGYSGEPNEQEAAVAETRRLGGTVVVDETRPEKPVVCANLIGTEVTDAGLVHLKGLTRLYALDLRFTRVTKEGVKKLQRALPNCSI